MIGPSGEQLLSCSGSRSKDTLLECIFLWQKSPMLGSLTAFLRMRLRRQSFSGSRRALVDFTGLSARARDLTSHPKQRRLEVLTFSRFKEIWLLESYLDDFFAPRIASFATFPTRNLTRSLLES